MNASEIIERLAPERRRLRGLGVSGLRLFGSSARGSDNPASDADFIVSFSKPATFDCYMDVKLHLESVLGIPVDLVTEAALRPELRAEIEQDAMGVA